MRLQFNECTGGDKGRSPCRRDQLSKVLFKKQELFKHYTILHDFEMERNQNQQLLPKGAL